jgi:hypothetical protein
MTYKKENIEIQPILSIKTRLWKKKYTFMCFFVIECLESKAFYSVMK